MEVQVRALNRFGWSWWTKPVTVVTGSADADLRALTLERGYVGGDIPLNPPFSRNHFHYTAHAPTPNRYEWWVNLLATPVDDDAPVSINGTQFKQNLGDAWYLNWRIRDGYNPLVFVSSANNGPATRTYRVDLYVGDPPPVPPSLDFAESQADVHAYVGEPLSVTLPQASGGTGTFYAYTLTGSAPFRAQQDALTGLPLGLTFDPQTRILSGTPDDSLAANYRGFRDQLTLTARDSEDVTGTLRFTIAFARAPTFAAPPPAMSFTVGLREGIPVGASYDPRDPQIRKLFLPAVNGGFGFGYGEPRMENLPPGLSFVRETLSVGGVPAKAGAFESMYIVEEPGLDTLTANIPIRIAAVAPAAPSGLRAAPAGQQRILNWDALGGVAAGGTTAFYRVRWAKHAAPETWLNPGGAPGENVGDSVSYTVTGLENGTTYALQISAYNAAGASEWSPEVLAAPAEVLSFTAPQPNLYFHVAGDSVQVNAILPAAQYGGGGVYTYSVTGLPPDLTFNAQTRLVGGALKPTAPAAVTYTVNSNSQTFAQTFTIAALPFALDVDGDGKVNVRDGILIARYLFGVRGPALLAGQTGADYDAVIAVLKNGAQTNALDVDGSGKADAKDGILIARYLFGARKAMLLRNLSDELPQEDRDKMAADVVETINALKAQAAQ